MKMTASNHVESMQVQSAPAISVVMPSRNAAKFVDEAISSILDQTFTDFELIICDDASSDETREKIAAWAAKDKRIRVDHSDICLGPANAANKTVSLARAPLIVRMDADDISEPTRLAKQYAVMRDNPDIVVFGSMYHGIDKDSRKIYEVDRAALLRPDFGIPCGHAMSIMRRDALGEIGGYRKQCDFWEDFDVIFRLAAIGRVCFGVEPLYRYRHSRAHARVNADLVRIESALELRQRCNQQFFKTGEYESVLATERVAPDARISPTVPLAIASLHILAGNSPRLVRRFLTRARLRPLSTSMPFLVKLLLARIAPKALRSFHSWRRVVRDKKAMEQIGSETMVEWHWSKHHPTKRKQQD